jgi:hypothetical protein
MIELWNKTWHSYQVSLYQSTLISCLAAPQFVKGGRQTDISERSSFPVQDTGTQSGGVASRRDGTVGVA